MKTRNKTAIKLTVREAVSKCRQNMHGSYNYQMAFSDLMNHYRSYHQDHLNPTLEELWGWVDGYLLMQEAAYGETPLG